MQCRARALLRCAAGLHVGSYHERVKLIRLFQLFCAALSMAQAQAPDAGGTAKKALDLFLAGKYVDLGQMFAPAYKEHYSEADLAKMATNAKTYGDVVKIGQPAVSDM